MINRICKNKKTSDIFSEVTPENEITILPFDKMLNFTKTVSCLVIGTAQQIDTNLCIPFEKFPRNLLVKFYSMKDFSSLTHELKQRKTLVWGLL